MHKDRQLTLRVPSSSGIGQQVGYLTLDDAVLQAKEGQPQKRLRRKGGEEEE